MSWTLTRLKHVASVRFGFPFNARRFNESFGMPVVRIRDLETQDPPTLTDEPAPEWARVRAGDVLIGMDGEFRAVVWKGRPSWLNQRVCAIDPRAGADGRFLAYAAGSPLADVESVKFSTTVKHLSAGDVLNLPLAVPASDEQRRIADFLDAETARIDGMIMVRAHQADLLQERSAAVRDNAIAAAGNPTRLAKALAVIEQGWSPECEARMPERSEWGVLKAGATNYGVFRGQESKALPAGLAPRPEFEVRPGDVLMSRANTRELAGSAAFVEDCRPQLMFSDKLYRVVPVQSKLEPRYLALALQSSHARERIEAETVGSSSSMQNISQRLVRDLRLPIPSLEQQTRIVAQCTDSVARTRAATSAIDRQIALLRERRQALITAAVTGKLRVPGTTKVNAAA